jgi:hypothetical protein
LKGLAAALGGDASVAQLAALMRLPGFANRKYADTPEATILEAALERRFNPDDFREYFLVLPTEDPRTAEASDSELGIAVAVLGTCGFLQWCREHPATSGSRSGTPCVPTSSD